MIVRVSGKLRGNVSGLFPLPLEAIDRSRDVVHLVLELEIQCHLSSNRLRSADRVGEEQDDGRVAERQTSSVQAHYVSAGRDHRAVDDVVD